MADNFSYVLLTQTFLRVIVMDQDSFILNIWDFSITYYKKVNHLSPFDLVPIFT